MIRGLFSKHSSTQQEAASSTNDGHRAYRPDVSLVLLQYVIGSTARFGRSMFNVVALLAMQWGLLTGKKMDAASLDDICASMSESASQFPMFSVSRGGHPSRLQPVNHSRLPTVSI